MFKKTLLLMLLMAFAAPWAANAQEPLTVYDQGGTTTNQYVPIYGYYADYGCRSQFIIPASKLEDVQGGTIEKLTFYLSSSVTLDETFTVYLKEVDYTTFSSATLEDWDGMTAVYTNTVTVNSDNEMEIDFSTTPFSYGDGNLMIGFQVTTNGSSSPRTYWYGEEQATGSYTAVYNYANSSHEWYSSVYQIAFIPKTTITYTLGSTTATAPGVTTNSTPTSLTNTSVTLGGTITDMGGATGVNAGICYSTTATPTTSDNEVHSRYTSAEAYTKDITGLLPNTTYYYRAFAYNSANSLADPTYGDIYSFTTGGTITINQPANGAISATVESGSATTSNTYALPGQRVTLTATVVDGYSFDCWIVSGVTGTASGSTYTFVMPSNDVTVTASIVPTSGGSSSEFYYALASSVESGAKYLVVGGNQTTLASSTMFYAMEWNNTTSSSGYLDYGTPTFKDTEKTKISGITPRTSGHTLSDFVWTITASGSDYTLSAENGESTYYLIETLASDGNLHAYTTSNTGYDADKATWSIVETSNDAFVIHNPYWHTQYTSGTRYYYLYRGSSGFQNWYTSTAPGSVTSANYYMYLYKETSTTTYAITATASPSEGGSVAGSDYYANGATCTLTATPAFGYDFVSWTEGGTVVSTDAEYTFTVSSARTLVANFESQGSCIKPTDVAQAGAQAAHQAQLSWTENSGATQWEVVYSDDSDFDPDAATPVTVNENPTTTITGLNQATTYYVYVRAICGQNSHSGWSNKASFVTISGHQAPTVSYDPSTLTANEVTVTWTGVATNVLHQSYDVYYSTSDATPTSSQVPSFSGLTGTSKELTGLIGNTEYYVWVRDNCGTDGYSDWSASISFSTLCESITNFPWRENFNGLTVANTIPNCWDNSDRSSSLSSGYEWCFNTNTSGNGATNGTSHDNSKCVRFNSYSPSSGLYGCLKTPVLSLPAQPAMELSFWYKNPAGGTFKVYISTDGGATYSTALTDALTGAWTEHDAINLSAYAGQEVVIVFKAISNCGYGDAYMYLDDVTVKEVRPCLKPTGLTCTDYTATTATFSWTANGANQTAWQLYISETNVAPADDIDPSLVINANTNPFTVTSGLTAEHTYYAWVRGNCTASSEGYSEWSESIEFMPSQYKDFTYQETASSSTGYLPIYGSYTNNATNKGQILIPATYFPAEMLDATVRRLTFYTTSYYPTADWGTAEFDVLVAEVDATSFESATFFDWTAMTTVYSGSLSVSGNQMVVNLDTPFNYTGGNLVIGFNLTTTGTTQYVTWVATNGSTYLGAYQYGTSSVSRSYYQPMITFNYLPNATPRPINPHATEELSTEATVAWTAPNSTEVVGYQYQYKLATVTEWPTALTSTTALTAPISGLTPEETYDFRVRAVYPGPAYSQYAETQFTTTASCPIPDGFTASNTTMNTADLTWNASSEVANYMVEYRTAAGNNGSMLNQNFNDLTEANSIPEGWDNAEGTTTGASYKWCYNTKTSGNGQAVGPDNKPCVVFDSYNNDEDNTNFLKTPAMNFPAGKTMQLSFWWKNPAGGDFSVYISTDGGTTKTAIAEGLTGQSTWTQKEIDLTGYEGASNVTIHFKGTSNWGYGDAYIYLDDVVIGEVVPAGTWTEATHEAPNTGAYTITLPNAGVKYDVRVYAECALNPETESATTTFTTLADGNKVFTNATADGKWSTDDNWAPAGAPVITDNAILRANATIESGTVAQAKKITFEGTTTPTLTINDGGQLKTDNNVIATVKKHINKYNEVGNHATGVDPDGYYLIGNPLSSGIYVYNTDNTYNIRRGTYDLYSWSRTSELEWTNYGADYTSYLYMNNGTGYLYANAANVDLTFTGIVKANNTDVTKDLGYTAPTAQAGFSNWNLFANPFVCNAYVTPNAGDGNPAIAYYKMNSTGTGFEASTAAIAPMEGIFVEATAESQTVKFSRNAAKKRGQLNINLTQNVNTRGAMGSTDNAIVRFDGGMGLEKFSFRQGSTKIYITEEGKDYAVVNADQVGEIPVSFKANENGSYTLSFTSEEVSFSYLHLIDNLTGIDSDLLANPSYSFDAQSTDYAQRFRLVFATGTSVDDDSFGFINANGNLCIFGIEGEATVQVFDVLGHMLSSETFNGSYEKRINGAPGVYMVRLINGNDVKVQKIVVR